MSLPLVKELAAAGKDGSIRPDELRELWALLPGVIEMARRCEVALAEFDRKAAYYANERAAAKSRTRERTMHGLEAAYKWCACVLRWA